MLTRFRRAFERALLRWRILATDEESVRYDLIDQRLDALAAQARLHKASRK